MRNESETRLRKVTNVNEPENHKVIRFTDFKVHKYIPSNSVLSKRKADSTIPICFNDVFQDAIAIRKSEILAK